MSFHELRILTVPDQPTLDSLIERIGDYTVPLFARHGVVTRGVWTSAGGPTGVAGPELSLYHWVEHPGVQEAALAWPAIRADSAGTARSHLEVELSSLPLDPIDSLRRDLDPELAGVEPLGPDGTRLYELRLYSPLAGHADDLTWRFEQFTLGLFDQHGLANVAYFTEHPAADAPVAPAAQPVPVPANGDDGEPRMAFLLAHPSAEAAIATWAAVAAEKDSVPDDGLPVSLLAGKTISYLQPTSYSPLR